MTRHTQGEWRVNGLTRIEANNFGLVAQVVLSPEYLSQEETKANARLIAAAPELLEALKYLLEEVCTKNGRPFDGATEEATAAINKARGQI